MSIQIFTVLGQKLHLLPEKAIWWEDQNALIIADLHIGKSAHFRKNGIPIPNEAHNSDIQVLDQLMNRFTPQKVFFLGDLFHSHENADVLSFGRFTALFPQTEFHLILGNHDILPRQTYSSMRLVVHEAIYSFPPFVFAHDRDQALSFDGYLLSGHVHPMVVLEGKGRQSMRMPCFYFGEKFGILPAFGSFKGGVEIGIKKRDIVFGVSKIGVVDLNSI